MRNGLTRRIGGRTARAPVRLLLAALAASAAMAAVPARATVALTDIDYSLEPLALAPALPGQPIDATPMPLLIDAAIAAETNTADPQPLTAAVEADSRRLSFGEHSKAIKTELLGTFAYMTAVNALKLARRKQISSFSFHDEGFFGRDTRELGVDKLVHAHNTYMLAEIIGARIRRNTGTTRGTAMSGALLATGFMLYSEVYDGFKGGFGVHDLLFNSLGAGFSVVRNTVPGLEDKLDFRVLIIPNRQVYSPTGHEHYRQLRYLFALELGGFERLRKSPLRFVELHAGYYGTGFTSREEKRGEERQRKLFAGVGINLNELFFNRKPRGRFERSASQVLDYWQPPYTYVHAK